MFNNVLRMQLKHVIYVSLVDRSSECEIVCNKGNKM
jgi:hypothetical protein